MINNNQRMILVHVGGTGGSYIGKLFGFNQKRIKGHKPYYVIKKKFPYEWDNYYKICTVRNPWAQYYSIFRRFANTRTARSVYHRKFDTKGVIPIEWFRDLTRHQKYHKRYSVMYGNLKQYDTVVKYENYGKYVKKIMLDNDMLVRYTDNRSQIDYRPFYTDETIEFVRIFRRKDITTFGYEFGSDLKVNSELC
jgi:hypothetical protein